MKAYVMDAFSAQIFGGNQAGVALPETTLSDALMQQIAAEFKHSETAFVQKESDGTVTLRYFTPQGRWSCAVTPPSPPSPCSAPSTCFKMVSTPLTPRQVT